MGAGETSMVDNSREVYGSVRVEEKNQKNVWCGKGCMGRGTVN